MSLIKKGISSAKYTIFYRILSQGVSLIATILLVRILSEKEYGIYNLLYSSIALLNMFFSFGIINTLQRYLPEYYHKGEFVLAHNLYRLCMIIRLLSNVIILGLILILWDYIAPFFKMANYKNYFAIFSIIILLHMQRGILETCLNSYFLHKYTQLFSFIFVLIKGIGYITAIFIKFNLWHVLIIDLIAYLVIFTLLQWIYCNKIPTKEGNLANFIEEERRRIFRYALFYNFNDAGVGLLDVNFDNFLIVMYLNPVAVGAYSFSQRITKSIGRILPINYLTTVIQPLFFSINQKENSLTVNRNCQLLIKFVYIFHFPIFFFLFLYAKNIIITIFDGKFLNYSNILIGVYFFTLLNAFQMPVGLVAQLYERADVIFFSKIFSIYNLIADIIFIKYFGIWGAVLATGTATLGKNLFIWYFVRDRVTFKEMIPYFIRLLLYWLSITTMCYIINVFIVNDYYSLILGSSIFVFFFIFQFRFIHLYQYEKELIYNIVKQSYKIYSIIKWIGLEKSLLQTS